jgi:hypothetical protein
MRDQTNNYVEPNVVRKVLANEIAQVIAIAGFIWFLVVLVILPIQRNSQRLDTIEQNHLKTIQDQIVEIKADLKTNNIDHIKIIEVLGRIEGKLE